MDSPEDRPVVTDNALTLGGWWSGILARRADADIPRARLTPVTVAKFLTDELLHASTRLASRARMKAPHFRRRLRDEAVGVEEYFSSNGWIDEPASFHREPPRLVAPEVRWALRGGRRFEHFTFDSGYEPRPHEPGRDRWLGYLPNHTAHVWLMRHACRGRPWLVCINGFRTGFASIDMAAFRLAELHRTGLNVACYVLPLHGPRKVGRWSGDRFFRIGYLNTIHAEAQAVWDLRRLLGWVRSHEADRVGVYGLSLGGYTAALLSAFEPDLACVIAGIPATDFVRIMQRHAPEDLVAYSRSLGLDWDAVERIMRVVSPLKLVPRVPRDRRYIFGGLVDRIVEPEQVRDLWLHWDKPRIAWYHGNHFSFNYEPEVKALLRDALRESELAGAGI